MSGSLFQNATTSREPAARPLGLFDPSRAFDALRAHRRVIVDYLQVLGGASGRLALQTVYFLILANTLNLRDMGVFASVAAAGMILGCFTGLGFQALLFRTATARPRALGATFAAYYVAVAASLPIAFAAAGALYLMLFAPSIGVIAYFTIIAVEVGCWRFIEMLVQVNNGLGRYSAAAHVLMASAGLRALAALAFLVAGGGDVTRWSAFYLVGNALAFAMLGWLYHPRVRLRWKPAIFVGRLRDGLLFTFSYFAFLGQNEVDKLVILQLAGDRMVGVYVITMRILDLTAAPLRPLFVIYSRKLLLAGRAKARLLGEIVQFEALIAASSIAGCIALVAILTRWPNALGHNIASAHGLLAALLVVPAAKNLIEFHSELFFAFDRMGVRGACAWGVLALKAGAIALLIRMLGGGGEWGPWLNAIYLVLYLMSLATLRALLARERRACERRACERRA